MRRILCSVFGVLSLAVVVVACGEASPPTATPTPSPIPTFTPVPSPSPTPTPSPTPAPTPTHTPAPTPTFTPSPTPTPSSTPTPSPTPTATPRPTPAPVSVDVLLAEDWRDAVKWRDPFFHEYSGQLVRIVGIVDATGLVEGEPTAFIEFQGTLPQTSSIRTTQYIRCELVGENPTVVNGIEGQIVIVEGTLASTFWYADSGGLYDFLLIWPMRPCTLKDL